MSSQEKKPHSNAQRTKKHGPADKLQLAKVPSAVLLKKKKEKEKENAVCFLLVPSFDGVLQ